MFVKRLAQPAVVFALSCAVVFSQVPPNAEVRKILAERIGMENLGVALVVGVIDANGRRVVSYGSFDKNDKRPLNGDTVFEIGSMTKVFTSLLLMDMVRKGEVSLTDPVSKFLPDSVKIPERDGRKITLADLSTQSSGLPRMPSNLNPKNPDNPYADYTVQQMYDFLAGYQLTRDIGSKYEYSNLGVGLLGHALALRAGKSYEALVKERICGPLGMTDTNITLTPAMKARLAVGHTSTLAPAANWDLPVFAGAGGLRSTANDILTFLAANLGYVKTPLAQAMADEVSIRRPVGSDMEIAYGWHVLTKGGSSIVWHNGGTGGYRTYMGYDPKARTGVVVLSNMSTPQGPDDIGQHLLIASIPLLKLAPPAERTEIAVAPEVFDRYAGAYRLGSSTILTMSRDGSRFYTQLTGQPRIEVFAESERKFFLKVVDAQLTFDVDPSGTATQVILHQNGIDQAAKRLAEADVKSAADAIEARNAAIAKRFKDQTQSPGTETALGRTLKELQQGEPNYDLMSSQVAAATRAQLPQLKSLMADYGALQSLTFKGVGSAGADIYDVKFEHATAEWRIMLGPDGKTERLLH